jgi:hypothetical protein
MHYSAPVPNAPSFLVLSCILHCDYLVVVIIRAASCMRAR